MTFGSAIFYLDTSVGRSLLFDNRPQKGRAGAEILAPKVTCHSGGERLGERLGCEVKMASRQPAGRRRYTKTRDGCSGLADNSEC